MDSTSMKLISEGKTKIYLRNFTTSKKGPTSKEKHAFYNPSMELNRDLSICVLQWLINKSKIFILENVFIILDIKTEIMSSIIDKYIRDEILNSNICQLKT